jgi:hypothetical protein
LKTNSARFSDAISSRSWANRSARSSWTTSVLSALATSPAKRPTPTMLTGPEGSRSPLPNAALATPTIFSGIWRTTPAVCASAVPT